MTVWVVYVMSGQKNRGIPWGKKKYIYIYEKKNQI